MARTEERNEMKVYHAREPIYRGSEFDRPLDRSAFELVAEVKAVNLEEAFRLTNTVDQEWWLNEQVTVWCWACRSTSVGDVIETADGEGYLVERVGFYWLGTWLSD